MPLEFITKKNYEQGSSFTDLIKEAFGAAKQVKTYDSSVTCGYPTIKSQVQKKKPAWLAKGTVGPRMGLSITPKTRRYV